LERRRHVAADENARERNAAAEPFAGYDDIGHDAEMLESEPFAGAADAGLAFVDDEEDATLLAVGVELMHPLDRGDVDAAAADDQLEHDASGSADQLGDLLAVGEAFALAA